VSEPIPWNMVFSSAFKLDHQNICVLWYDLITDSNDEKKRVLRASQLNVIRNSWQSIRVTMKEDLQELNFRIGAGLLPKYNDDLIFLEKK